MLLTTPESVRIAEAVVCENLRLIRLFGPAKAESIGAEVDDTLSAALGRDAKRRLDSALAHRVIRANCKQ
jgi:hypothetical protein